jgi:uncharacterized membrane protein
MAAAQALKGLKLPQNMGQMDRIIRSAIGGALLMNGLARPASLLCRIAALIGGAFIFYRVTGDDPLLQATDTTTLPEDNKNLIRKAKNQLSKSNSQTPEATTALQIGGV